MWNRFRCVELKNTRHLLVTKSIIIKPQYFITENARDERHVELGE